MNRFALPEGMGDNYIGGGLVVAMCVIIVLWLVWRVCRYFRH